MKATVSKNSNSVALGSTVNVDPRLFSSYEYNTALVVIDITDKGYTLLTVSNKPLFNIPLKALKVINN